VWPLRETATASGITVPARIIERGVSGGHLSNSLESAAGDQETFAVREQSRRLIVRWDFAGKLAMI